MRAPTSQDAQYAWYFSALKHGAGSPQAPIHADEPQCGYFRLKLKDGALLPAYIAMEGPVDPETGELAGDERLICYVGKVARDPHQAWTWLAGHPIAYEAFDQAWKTGVWPDQAPGANFQPSDDLDGLLDQLATMLETKAKLPKVVSTQTECDQAANLKDRLLAVHKGLEALRKAEKEPHDKAAAAVQAKFLPWLGKARDAADELRQAMSPFLLKAQEAAKRAAAEACGESAAAALSVRPTAGGLEGKRTSLRGKKVPVIVHYKSAALSVLDEPEVVAAVEKAVKRLFREGKTAPGVEVKEEATVI